MLHMNERPVGDVMILDLRGTIAPGPAEIGLGDKVRSIFYRGYRKLVLNLAGVTSSDASGISSLLGVLLSARDGRAEVKLLHVTKRLTDMLIIIALHRYFAVFESEADALESFQVQSGAPSEAAQAA